MTSQPYGKIDVPHMDRLLYLYSEANAEDLDVIKYWEEKILQFCVKQHSLQFTAAHIEEEFTINDIFPSSFLKVFHKLVLKKNSLCPLKDLTSSEVDVLQSIFSAISLWSGAINDNKTPYVPMRLIVDVENLFLSFVSTSEDRVVFVKTNNKLPAEFSFRGLLELAGKAKEANHLSPLLRYMNEEDSEVLLKHMVKNKRAVLSADLTMVKLAISAPDASVSDSVFSYLGLSASNQDSAKMAQMQVFSEADEATLLLKSSIRQVEDKIEELRENVADLIIKAKKCKVHSPILVFVFISNCCFSLIN
jgi:hypothetical protein